MQTGTRWISLITCLMLVAAHSPAETPEKAGLTDPLKKRLAALDQQVAGSAKDAGDDAGMTAALQKRDAAIGAMKAHLEKMIAAQEAGDKETIKTLNQQDLELGKELARANHGIEFARRTSKFRKELEEVKRRKAEHPEADTGDVETILSELVTLFEGMAANPPEGKGMDDATGQKLTALESKLEQAHANAEFKAMQAKIQRQIEEAGGNEAVKAAGDKLLDSFTRTRDARLAVGEARAREQAILKERIQLDAAFRDAMVQARKDAQAAAKEAAQKEKEQPKDKPAAEPAK